jgi:hypothetical protein
MEVETRLQALDFWVRYLDYLADELLAQFLESSQKLCADTGAKSRLVESDRLNDGFAW